jgi:hypothetical protein
MHRFGIHPLDIEHTLSAVVITRSLSAVVPAQAGTHNPCVTSCPPTVPRRNGTAYGSPPSRGRQEERFRQDGGTVQ